MLCYICLAAAAIIGFVLVPMANQSTRETIGIVRIVGQEPIPVGTLLTKEMLTNVEVGAYGLPDNAARRVEDIVGFYTIAELFPGDTITTDKVSPSLPQDNNLYSIAKGTCAVSVDIGGLSRGFSGKLQEGDVVSAYAILKDESSPTGVAVSLDPLLQYMEILSVSTSKATNADASKAATPEGAIAATVTFRCTPNQAAKLIEINSTGSIHLTFVGRTDEAKSQLKAFNKYVKEQQGE